MQVTPGDGHLYYTFRPPWVTSRITDTFFALHPEQRVYADAKFKATRTEAASTRSALGDSSIGAAAAATGTGTGTGASANGEVVRPDLA